MRLQHLGLALGLASLAACRTIGPDYQLPEQSAYRDRQANAPFQDTANPALAANAELPSRWWELYHDDTLNGLIRQALADNHELKVAAANLQRAAALYQQALDVGGLKGNATAAASRAQISPESFLLSQDLPTFNLADASFSLSRQLDLFGRLKRMAEAAEADEQASAAALDLARISVAAQVAGSYAEICHANHELHVAEHALQLQRDNLQMVERLISAGRGTPQQRAQAHSRVALSQSRLPPLHAHQQAAQYQLAALLGRVPGQLPAAVADCHHAPELSAPMPIGDGAALLSRRPDIRQAERQLAAATARVGVAIGELYPDIRLGASLGAAGLLQDFGSSLTRQWSLGPLIAWSMPTKGTAARIQASQAGAEAALARFDASVLDALRQTQTALSRYAHDLDQLQAMQRVQQQAALVAAQDARLYQAGRAPYQAHLEAELALAQAESSVADAQAQVSRDQIQLFLALGGGWNTPPAP